MFLLAKAYMARRFPLNPCAISLWKEIPPYSSVLGALNPLFACLSVRAADRAETAESLAGQG